MNLIGADDDVVMALYGDDEYPVSVLAAELALRLEKLSVHSFGDGV